MPKLTTKLLSGGADSSRDNRDGGQNLSRVSKGSKGSNRNKSRGKVKSQDSSKSSEKTNIQFFKNAKKNLLLAEQVFDDNGESMSSFRNPKQRS